MLTSQDEYWKAHPELQHIPVYYASRLASKALRVFQTFVNTMSEHIRTAMDSSNPFRLQCVQSMTSGDFQTNGPCVVMAAPGFLQTGVSRELFELWCEEEKNAVIVAGYTVEGTLAHDLLTMPREIFCLDGRIKQRRCLIEHISFSAHVDFVQNLSFIRSVVPDNIILVHGERTGMKRLKDELDRDIRKSWPTSHRPSVAMPENGVKVKLLFNKPLEAEVVGEAAASLLAGIDKRVKGESCDVQLPPSTLLVTEEFSSRVLAPTDLPQFTHCRTGSIAQRAIIPMPVGFGLLELSLEHLRSSIEEIFDDVQIIQPSLEGAGLMEAAAAGDTSFLLVQGTVSVHKSSSPPGDMPTSPNSSGVIVSWPSGPISDVIADGKMSLNMYLSSSSIF